VIVVELPTAFVKENAVPPDPPDPMPTLTVAVAVPPT
jgi:hypothetical protein